MMRYIGPDLDPPGVHHQPHDRALKSNRTTRVVGITYARQIHPALGLVPIPTAATAQLQTCIALIPQGVARHGHIGDDAHRGINQNRSNSADCNAGCTRLDEKFAAPKGLSWSMSERSLHADGGPALVHGLGIGSRTPQETTPFIALRQYTEPFMPLRRMQNLTRNRGFPLRGPSRLHQLVGDLGQSADYHHRER